MILRDVSNISIKKQLERRRKAATRQLRAGMTCRVVAKSIGVSKSTVSRWNRASANSQKVIEGVKGRPSKLSARQIGKLKTVLLKGASQQGYESDHWTLKRISDLIERLFEAKYEASAVWHLMKRIGWSRQKPQLRSVQRDEDQIEHWRQYVFPQLKKSNAAGSQDDFLG